MARRKQHSDETKEKAHALYVAGTPAKQIAETLGVPLTTINDWISDRFPLPVDTDEELRLLKLARQKEREKLITRAWELAHTAIEQAFNAMPNASAKDAANIASQMIDKALLLEGHATQKIQYEVKNLVDELPPAVKAELAQMLNDHGQ